MPGIEFKVSVRSLIEQRVIVKALRNLDPESLSQDERAAAVRLEAKFLRQIRRRKRIVIEEFAGIAVRPSFSAGGE